MQEAKEKTNEEMEALIQRQGGMRFSLFVGLMMILALCSRCWWFYQIPWFIQEPKYICVWKGHQRHQDQCIPQNICNDDSIISYHIDYSDPISLHNWIEKLDLVCAPKWKLGLLSSAYFIGYCITLLWFPVLADRYGRRPIFIAGAIMDLILYTGIMYTSNANVMIALSFTEGLLASCS